MKHYIAYAIILLSLTLFIACGEDEIEENLPEVVKQGEITFGANSHIINCVTSVEVFINDQSIGVIPSYADSLVSCGVEGNLTKTLDVGSYTYKAVITGGGDCNAEESATITISENECTKVFLDYTVMM